jgi:hypothetical protein
MVCGCGVLDARTALEASSFQCCLQKDQEQQVAGTHPPTCSSPASMLTIRPPGGSCRAMRAVPYPMKVPSSNTSVGRCCATSLSRMAPFSGPHLQQAVVNRSSGGALQKAVVGSGAS